MAIFMPNAQIDCVGLDPVTLQILQRNNFGTARDVLFASAVDLVELLNITGTQALELQKTVSAHVCPAYTSVSQAVPVP